MIDNVINLGSIVKGRVKGPNRPKELFLRLTYETLSESLKNEVMRKRFIQWLYHVLNTLEKPRLIND